MPMSQIDTGVLANFLTPRGQEQITLSGTPSSLTIPSVGNTVPLLALIQGDDGDVRWQDDGTNPTASTGFIIFEKATLQYNAIDLTKIKLIASNVNPATKVNVSYYSYATEQEIPTPLPPFNPYCPVINLTELFSANATCSVIGGNDLTTTNIAGGLSNCAFTDLANTIGGVAGDIIVAEYTVESISAFNSPQLFVGLIDDISGAPPSVVIAANILFNSNTGDVDILSGNGTPFATGLTLTFPYTFHIEMHMDTGLVDFTDGTITSSAGNGGVGGVGINLYQAVNLAAPTNAGDSINLKVNAGSSAFTFPLINPNAKTWCQV